MGFSICYYLHTNALNAAGFVSFAISGGLNPTLPGLLVALATNGILGVLTLNVVYSIDRIPIKDYIIDNCWTPDIVQYNKELDQAAASIRVEMMIISFALFHL